MLVDPSALIHVEVFIGAAPLLELRLAAGLLEFGRAHPRWRFSLRGADFRYTPAWLQRHRVSGALVVIDAAPVQRALKTAGVPWVHLLPGRPVAGHAVDVDDAAIGRMGAEKFLDLGFSNFAYCGVQTPWSSLRGVGFVGRLAENGLDCARTDIAFVQPQSWTLQPQAEQLLVRWIRKRPRRTAVMAAHDVLACRLVDVCVRYGIRVPDDVAILGVGNHELACELTPVPVSSVDTAVPEVAQRGARLLQKLIEKRRVAPGCERVAPRSVIERRSTEVQGFDDTLVADMVAHIRDHVCDGLTVAQLITAFKQPCRTLTRRFSAAVGRSPGAEIRLARLRHARNMLLNTKLSLTEIAADCGFFDLAHMDRAFRAVYACAPGDLRRR